MPVWTWIISLNDPTAPLLFVNFPECTRSFRLEEEYLIVFCVYILWDAFSISCDRRGRTRLLQGKAFRKALKDSTHSWSNLSPYCKKGECQPMARQDAGCLSPPQSSQPELKLLPKPERSFKCPWSQCLGDVPFILFHFNCSICPGSCGRHHGNAVFTKTFCLQ